ncbi:hypothetical protein NPIL_90061 [Nephila pilipes]|uniref:Uncharacterized protein n=1 Tax=Nephila pilipes TaxID=299642 RepID=A0A8X6T8R6_NEPPI|nr:hypothetical protein NPIL_90061 [Nephila pilipes]
MTARESSSSSVHFDNTKDTMQVKFVSAHGYCDVGIISAEADVAYEYGADQLSTTDQGCQRLPTNQKWNRPKASRDCSVNLIVPQQFIR